MHNISLQMWGNIGSFLFFFVLFNLLILVLKKFESWGQMGLVATKPVFGVSDKVRFKPACSATETS